MKRCPAQPVVSFLRPEFPFAAGVICGCACAELVMLPVSAALAAAGFYLSRRSGASFLLGMFLGACSLAVHCISGRMAERQLPGYTVNAVLLCRCTDTGAANVEKIPVPGSFTAEILKINGKECRYHPEILVINGRNGLLPEHGQILSGSGPLLPVDPENTAGRRLDVRGITRIWKPDKLENVSPGRGIINMICRIRDKMLERVTDGMNSDRAAMMTGTMFFGTAGRFDRDMRKAFINSGTIHLFSISGMHLTAIAVLLMLLMNILPLYWRYGMLILLTGIYALSTGANPPVMRAYLVVTLIAAGKMLYVSKNIFDLLCLAAAVLFLCEPELVYDTGTQYSFFITAVLILAGKMTGELKENDLFCISCIPGNPEAFRLKKVMERRWKIIGILAVCLAAFVSGIGISAVNRNIIAPGAVLTNLVLLPVIPLLFAIVGTRLIAGPLLPAVILEKAVLLLDSFCAECAEIFTSVTPAASSGFEAVLFCVALLVFYASSSWKIRKTALLLAVSLLCFRMIQPYFMRPAAAVISSDPRREPVIVIAEPRIKTGFLVNASGCEEAQLASEILLDRGIREPEALLFTDGRISNVSGIGTYLEKTPPLRVRLPDSGSGGLRAKLAELGVKNPASGGREREFAEIFREKSAGRLEYFHPGSNLRFRIDWHDTPEGRFFSVDGTKIYIPWGNKPEVVIHEFRR